MEYFRYTKKLNVYKTAWKASDEKNTNNDDNYEKESHQRIKNNRKI